MASRLEDLERRVVGAAEAALAERQVVSPVDVLVGLGWLAPSHVAGWRQGRMETLEETLTVSPAKLSAAWRAFEGWAGRRGLVASETAYVARTVDQDEAAGMPGEASGHVQQPVAQPLRLAAAELAVLEEERLRPGEQVLADEDEFEPP